MKKILNILVALLPILILLVSCNPYKPPPRTSPEGKLPQTFSIYSSEPDAPDRWWETFDDPELNTLIEEALSGNFSIKEAWARLVQARALTLRAGSSLYPDLNINAGASRARQRSELSSDSSKSGSLSSLTTSTRTSSASTTTVETYRVKSPFDFCLKSIRVKRRFDPLTSAMLCGQQAFAGFAPSFSHP